MTAAGADEELLMCLRASPGRGGVVLDDGAGLLKVNVDVEVDVDGTGRK